ncbi:MAG TPA: YicC family protein [Spirochaetota bacterium]|nr:YicC family protein [Spirochaetota bacterium]HOL56540.1 YicC family protein [Spirochaetota bacterium]HPP03641.1 YicC family protein [Spirochaetota bacterium]
MFGMTGYSFKELYVEKVYISTEIKSVNHRFLEINVILPYTLNSIEIKVRDFIQKRLKRGKIEVIINLKSKENNNNIEINESVTKQYCDLLRKLIIDYNLKDDVKLFHLTRFDDIFIVDKKRDYSNYWDIIEKSLEENINEIIEMKKNEGEATKKDIRNIINSIKNNLNIIGNNIEVMEKNIFENIKNKIIELIGDKFDETRIINEAAVMVTKSSINEEFERLKMYIEQFEKIMEEDNDVGKRIDFLCQEMHREINTIGSKISLPKLTENVILIKNDIEKIREQIRNIE